MSDQDRIVELEAKLKEAYQTVKDERAVFEGISQQLSKERFAIDEGRKERNRLRKHRYDLDQKLEDERKKERLILLERWAEVNSDATPPGHLANDFAYLTEMFDRAGVSYEVDADISAMTRTLKVGSEGDANAGYSCFFCEHTFDEKGNLTEVGVWE